MGYKVFYPPLLAAKHCMYTNPFNYSANLFARAPDLTADLLFSEYQVLALGPGAFLIDLLAMTLHWWDARVG